MNFERSQAFACNRSARGMTLVEVMVAVGLSSLGMAGAMSLWLFSARSFASMGNYTELDCRSRYALDSMSREIREATAVIDFQSTGPTKRLAITNAALGVAITYSWDAATGTLCAQKQGEADKPLLTGCDRWDFALYQRTPSTKGGYVFVPATNAAGVYDVSTCKLINMSWKCSRTVLGNQVNTETVQTAQIVLRNKQ